MSPRRRTTAASGSTNREGITLLEVLVACGILVVGLASVASVMPAAGSRLAQATFEDRAAAAAANAYAELVNRGLMAGDVFDTGKGQASIGKACYFGAPAISQTMASLPQNSPAFNLLAPASSTVVASRIDVARGFDLKDDLSFIQLTGDTPRNGFMGNGTGSRDYRQGMCWWATVMPTAAAPPAGWDLATWTQATAPGAGAVVSVAVFKKPGDGKVIPLTSMGGALFEHSTSKFDKLTNSNNTDNKLTGAIDEQDRKRFLPGCSYVLALPPAATLPPQWLKVTSSWTNPGRSQAGGVGALVEDAATRESFVVLDLNPLGVNAANYLSNNGATLTVLAFENLMRVDHYTVSLD